MKNILHYNIEYKRIRVNFFQMRIIFKNFTQWKQIYSIFFKQFFLHFYALLPYYFFKYPKDQNWLSFSENLYHFENFPLIFLWIVEKNNQATILFIKNLKQANQSSFNLSEDNQHEIIVSLKYKKVINLFLFLLIVSLLNRCIKLCYCYIHCI